MSLKNLTCAAGALLVAFTSCVSTDVASQVAPEFVGHQFERVLVVADVGMLYERTVAEDLIVAELRSQRIDAVRSLDVVFGADTLPEDAFLKHAAKAGADAVLILRLVEEGSDAQYVPQHTTTTFSATESGGSLHGFGSSSTFGGRTVFKPWGLFRATLLETSTGRTAWYADAECVGTAESSAKDLVRNVAGEIADRVIRDGVMHSESRL